MSGPVEMDALMPAMPYASGVMNGQWVKQETVNQKPNETSHKNGLFTEVLLFSIGLISYSKLCTKLKLCIVN